MSKTKRILAFMLTLTMMLGLMIPLSPVPASADETGEACGVCGAEYCEFCGLCICETEETKIWKNILLNGDFLIGKDGDNVPGWENAVSVGDAPWWCAILSNDGPAPVAKMGSIGHAQQWVAIRTPVKLKEGGTYRFSAWAKVAYEVGENSAEICIVHRDVPVSGDWGRLQMFDFGQDTEWAKKEVEFSAAEYFEGFV